MKKLMFTAASLLIGIGLAVADTTIVDDNFAGYTGNLAYQGPWAAQNAFTNVPNDSAQGSNEVLMVGNYQRMPLTAEGYSIDNLKPGEGVRVTVDHRFESTWAANYDDFEIVLTDTSMNWIEGWRTNEGWPVTEPTIGMKIQYNNYATGTKKYWPNKANATNNATAILAQTPAHCGFQPNLGDGTSDVVRIIYTIMKSETTNEFEVAATFSNLTSGATLSNYTVPNIVATNAWNDDQMYVMLKSITPVGKCSNYVDRVKVELLEINYDVVLWQDDFNDTYFEQPVQWRAGWVANNNNEAYSGTADGTMVQRPGLSTNKTGVAYRGVVHNTDPFQPLAGQTMRIEFDWTMYTAELANNSWLDINLQTNAWDGTGWPPPATIAYNSDNAAMAFRLSQSAWPGPAHGQSTSNGTIRVVNDEDVQVGYFLPDVFGLAPNDGDHTGDVMRVTYTALKSTNVNEFVVNLSFSNTITGATADIDTQTVDSAAWYSQSDFWFSMYTPNNYGVGAEGNEFDNFIATHIKVPPPPLFGFNLFADEHGLSGVKTDDKDNDGLNDFGEYVFDGDPDDGGIGDVGTQPSIDGSTYYFSLIGDNTVVAHVLTNVNLVNGEWGTNSSLNVSETDGVLSEYTDDVGGSDQVFIKLIVE